MRHFVLSLILVLGLTACAGLDNAGRARLQNAVDSLDTAVFNGNKTPEIVLNSYKSMYKKYPQEPIAAGAYADALRRVNRPKEAADVLKPFVENRNLNKVPDSIFMPYVRLILDQGFFEDAEKRLKQRLGMPAVHLTGTATRPQLLNLLGVAYAGQNKREDAQKAFDAALAKWDGRPGVVERNIERLKAAQAIK